jgi:hypothetical protein
MYKCKEYIPNRTYAICTVDKNTTLIVSKLGIVAIQYGTQATTAAQKNMNAK